MADLVVTGSRILLPGGIRAAALLIEDGRIVGITEPDQPSAVTTRIEAGDLVVMPGLVDSHVHINEPGRTHWEGFETATRAGAAGGVTSIIDMPLNSIPPTVDPAALDRKRAAARGRCFVDVGFWGGLVPDNLDQIAPLVEAGVCGFKSFLVDSGVPEFPPVSEGLLRQALPQLASRGVPLLVHAERPERVRTPAGGSYRQYLASRPAAAEDEAIAMLVGLRAESRAIVHILHLASGTALAHLSGLSAETCPHYLTFSAGMVEGTEYKCAPPIRGRGHRDALWSGLADGRIAMVVSDHSPVPAELKEGDFLTAWGGISSLQLRLPALWTEARRRGHGLMDLSRWLSLEPARLAGIDRRKGSIEVGKDADLLVWDPDEAFVVDPARLEHRHAITPYAGRTLAGTVRTTILRGRVVYDQGRVSGPEGELLAP